MADKAQKATVARTGAAAYREALQRQLPHLEWAKAPGPSTPRDHPAPHWCAAPPGWFLQPSPADDGALRTQPPPWDTAVAAGRASLVATRVIPAGTTVLVDESLLTTAPAVTPFTVAAAWLPAPGGFVVTKADATAAGGTTPTALRLRRRLATRCAVAAAGALCRFLTETAATTGPPSGDMEPVAAWLASVVVAVLPRLVQAREAAHPRPQNPMLLGDDIVGEAAAAPPGVSPTFVAWVASTLRPHFAAATAAQDRGTPVLTWPPLAMACLALRHEGLHAAPRLLAFLRTATARGVAVHAPGLPERTALFPVLRRMGHECRPSCAVAFLDAPWSHGHAAHLPHETVTAGDAVLAPLLDRRRRPWHAVSRPSVAVVTALRDLRPGEPLTVAFADTLWRTVPERRALLRERFGFDCSCRWCTAAPDVARAFRCPECPPGEGVVCPWPHHWECLQCARRPSDSYVAECLEAERQLRTVKADKATGLAKLLGSATLHFTHALVVRKLDAWADWAWRARDAEFCTAALEALLKACDRCSAGDDDVSLAREGPHGAEREERRRRGEEQRDPLKAQYYEFLGKVQHAVGNAHTARHCYQRACEVRALCGQGLTFWYQVTRYMAEDKPLSDLMDGR